MTNFPLIARYFPDVKIRNAIIKAKDFGIEMKSILTDCDLIKASDLESALSKCVVVHGESVEMMGATFSTGDTHSGLLLGYAKIPETKPVGKEEIIKELLTLCEKRGVYFDDTHDLIQRIKAHGVTND